jgi:hypothetical protein
VLDKTGGIYLILSYLAILRAPQVLEMSIPQWADLLNESCSSASGKSMPAFKAYRRYFSAILRAATKEDPESKRQHACYL